MAKKAKLLKAKPVAAEQGLPKFESGRAIIGGTVVADVNGDLYRIDADQGTVRKVTWEKP